MSDQALRQKIKRMNRKKGPTSRNASTLNSPIIDLDDWRQRRGVKVVELFNMKDLQKDYRGYTMIYDGRRFRKIVSAKDATDSLTHEELKRFIIDIINAAKNDGEIYDYLKKNPFPFRKKRQG